jgi:hypothetical protein
MRRCPLTALAPCSRWASLSYASGFVQVVQLCEPQTFRTAEFETTISPASNETSLPAERESSSALEFEAARDRRFNTTGWRLGIKI